MLINGNDRETRLLISNVQPNVTISLASLPVVPTIPCISGICPHVCGIFEWMSVINVSNLFQYRLTIALLRMTGDYYHYQSRIAPYLSSPGPSISISFMHKVKMTWRFWRLKLKLIYIKRRYLTFF